MHRRFTWLNPRSSTGSSTTTPGRTARRWRASSRPSRSRASRRPSPPRSVSSTTTRRFTSASGCTTATRRRSSTTDTRRDAGLGEQDSFQIIFDTFRDQQNGFVFGTNAAGIQYDAQVRNQGDPAVELGRELGRPDDHHRGRAGRPSSASRCARCATGRRRRRGASTSCATSSGERERTYWAPLPRQFKLPRLSSAGELRGLELASAAQFQDPAVRRQLGQPQLHAGRRHRSGRRRSASTRSSASRRSLNLDVTYNTDFAQVEVDTQQINLTRFNLRFPGEAPVLPRELGPVHASARATSSICSSAGASASTKTDRSCRSRAAPA